MSSSRTSRSTRIGGRSPRCPSSALVMRSGCLARPKPSWMALYPSRSFVRTYVTTFASATMIVAATTEPSSLKCWSMPSLRPSSTGFLSAGAALVVSACSSFSSTFVSSVIFLAFLELDLDVDAGRKVQLHEGVDRFLRWVVDVDEPLVRPDLELLARVLVDERTLDDRELLDTCRQRDRTGDRRPGPLRGLDDLRRGLVDELVVVRLQADPDALLGHYAITFVTTPAPTVCPPSRMANRRPSSSAIGVIRVTSRVELSPGMIISVPVASFASPVTSVVRT